jgi:plasmid stabilization system protein ParE
MRLLKRPQFLLDLAEELNWLREQAGADVAEAWCASLENTIKLLRKQPLIGRRRKDLSPDTVRSWRIPNFPRWLIFCEIDEQGNVVLLRIRQGNINLAWLKMKS